MAAKPVRRAVTTPAKTAPKRPPEAGRLEAILARQGYRLVAGVDEVGRGALAGPLVAAGVVFDVDRIPEGMADSKTLTPNQREELAARVFGAAAGVSFVVVDSEDIDGDGLHVSNLEALVRAAKSLRPVPDYLISDCFPLERCGLPHVGLPKADGLSAAVAAASIVAKVKRDAFMRSLDAQYPGYGFAGNKGYSCPEHWAAIRSQGPSPIHRRSFRGVGSWQPSLGEF